MKQLFVFSTEGPADELRPFIKSNETGQGWRAISDRDTPFYEQLEQGEDVSVGAYGLIGPYNTPQAKMLHTQIDRIRWR